MIKAKVDDEELNELINKCYLLKNKLENDLQEIVLYTEKMAKKENKAQEQKRL